MLISNRSSQARSSGGEHYPDTVGVKGSNPFVPTSRSKDLKPFWLQVLFFDLFLPIRLKNDLDTLVLRGGTDHFKAG